MPTTPLDDLRNTLDILPRRTASEHSMLQMQGSMQSAIAITEALIGLTVAVEDLANRTVTRMNALSETITKASEQSAQTSALASTQAATASQESGALQRKLNKLTIWIVVAAIASGLGTVVQAIVAVRHW
jgi:hypothetical protein